MYEESTKAVGKVGVARDDEGKEKWCQARSGTESSPEAIRGEKWTRVTSLEVAGGWE